MNNIDNDDDDIVKHGVVMNVEEICVCLLSIGISILFPCGVAYILLVVGGGGL